MQPMPVIDISRRFEQNPLVSPDHFDPSEEGMTVECVLNPGVFRFDKKKWLLLSVAERPRQTKEHVVIPLRKESGEIEKVRLPAKDVQMDANNPRTVRYKDKQYPTTVSHLRLMCSDDGEVFHEPDGYDPIHGSGPLEAFGIEECRVTEINSIFHLTYAMTSESGIGVGLIQTRDWKRFERKGMILPPNNRDCAIFEEKIRDKYYALHSSGSHGLAQEHIWIAESPDCIHWGRHHHIASVRENAWDSVHIGPGCSPIRTPQGWLTIYHGSDELRRRCLGAILLDINDPSRVIARSETPIMEPAEPYEVSGFMDNVISSNGHLVIGDKLHLYYGAANKVICGAELSIHAILASLSRQK